MELPIPPEPNKLQRWLWKKRWFKEKLRRYLWDDGGWSKIFTGERCDFDCFLRIYSWFERKEVLWFLGSISWDYLIMNFKALVFGIVKCPVCGDMFKNVDALAKHIYPIAQSSEIGMGRDRGSKKHKKWLDERGVNNDYKSVKKCLEQIKDDVFIFQNY